MLKKVRFIRNRKGRLVGVEIPIKHFRRILKEIEDLECLRAYDYAKSSGDDVISIERAISEIEVARQ